MIIFPFFLIITIIQSCLSKFWAVIENCQCQLTKKFWETQFDIPTTLDLLPENFSSTLTFLLFKDLESYKDSLSIEGYNIERSFEWFIMVCIFNWSTPKFIL